MKVQYVIVLWKLILIYSLATLRKCCAFCFSFRIQSKHSLSSLELPCTFSFFFFCAGPLFWRRWVLVHWAPACFPACFPADVSVSLLSLLVTACGLALLSVSLFVSWKLCWLPLSGRFLPDVLKGAHFLGGDQQPVLTEVRRKKKAVTNCNPWYDGELWGQIVKFSCSD